MSPAKLLIGGILTAAALLGAAPAQASHHPCVRHPVDGPSGDRTLSCVERDLHNFQAVCDHDSDGNKAYGRYRLNGEHGYLLSAYDPDGAWGNCLHEGHWTWIAEFAICVQNQGCSCWKQTLSGACNSSGPEPVGASQRFKASAAGARMHGYGGARMS